MGQRPDLPTGSGVPDQRGLAHWQCSNQRYATHRIVWPHHLECNIRCQNTAVRCVSTPRPEVRTTQHHHNPTLGQNQRGSAPCLRPQTRRSRPAARCPNPPSPPTPLDPYASAHHAGTSAAKCMPLARTANNHLCPNHRLRSAGEAHHDPDSKTKAITVRCLVRCSARHMCMRAMLLAVSSAASHTHDQAQKA